MHLMNLGIGKLLLVIHKTKKENTFWFPYYRVNIIIITFVLRPLDSATIAIGPSERILMVGLRFITSEFYH
jgi:hypothetical protein